MNNIMKDRPVVAIAGAAGFVGQALMAELKSWYHIVGLTRGPVGEPTEKKQPGMLGVTWRQCDLFSLIDAEKALEGVDYAFYLVHSMMPSARLTQGRFQDMDLILADNFARAAEMAGVKQIIYLGGLVPDTKNLSWHLRSRLEVEQTLGSHGVPVTALRAGLIIGANGSTFRIMVKLVERLKLMAIPRWMLSQTHPIALPDIIQLLHHCMGNPKTFNESFDVGGPDIMTYGEMLSTIAEILGYKRIIKTIPYFPSRLASMMLSAITGSPRALVDPLVESLKYPMVASDRRLQEDINLPGMPFAQAVKMAISEKPVREKPLPVNRANDTKRKIISARSVQRLPLPAGKDADWVALHYSRWLPRLFMGTLVRVKVDQNGCYFYCRFIRKSLLDLTFSHARSSRDRPLYYITGGLLARLDCLQHRGRLEFREVLNNRYVLVALHDYCPTIPWFIYSITQAPLHLWVMGKYARHLKKHNRTKEHRIKTN